MTEQEASSGPLRRSGLYTVVVQSGRTRWGLSVRAASPEGAEAIARARGYEVVSVRAGVRDPAKVRMLPGMCVRCGYDLARLSAGETGGITCPECGALNLPQSPVQAGEQLWYGRRRLRLGCLGIAVIGTLLLWLSPALVRLF